jgi:hypothetical protein
LQKSLSSVDIDTLDLTHDSPVPGTTSFTFAHPVSPPSIPQAEQHVRRSPRLSDSPKAGRLGRRGSASPPAAWKAHEASRREKKRAIRLRESAVGLWAFEDATDSPVGADKSKARKKWRESEIGVLDLVDD